MLDAAPIGRGGQAEVFRAREKSTGAFVALKRVVSKLDDAVARMRREIEVQRSLDHQNIMPILEHSESFSWYSMPLAVRVLSEVERPIPDRLISEVVRSCLKALQVAHVAGCVHRDLTPSNILQIGDAAEQRWVVSDWGLVRRHGETSIVRTVPGVPFGTAGFAAPESWVAAHEADGRSDLYSLGRVVAWARTGQTPIPNVPLVPDGSWRQFVQAVTEPDPARRPADATVALELLNAAMEGPETPSADVSQNRRSSLIPEAVPDPVAVTIAKEAEAQFPDDYSTRSYQIRRDSEAWLELQALSYLDVPENVAEVVRQEAADAFPRDFSTQLYQVKRDLDAWRQLANYEPSGIPPDVFDGIVEKASREFPRDFATRLYQVEREVEAWRELHS